MHLAEPPPFCSMQSKSGVISVIFDSVIFHVTSQLNRPQYLFHLRALLIQNATAGVIIFKKTALSQFMEQS